MFFCVFSRKGYFTFWILTALTHLFFFASRRSFGQERRHGHGVLIGAGRRCLRHSGYGLHTAGIFDMACIGAWCVRTHEWCFSTWTRFPS
ncbi:hypothetical protein NEUTE2DRAFT_98500 [Neurospora tetrasperma FGSC 2509]|nr:hypothetical protein NEUTE2DRAFT_98500 [Neurospora tetrasperma FGSC 2509]